LSPTLRSRRAVRGAAKPAPEASGKSSTGARAKRRARRRDAAGRGEVRRWGTPPAWSGRDRGALRRCGSKDPRADQFLTKSITIAPGSRWRYWIVTVSP
jgi:hypothetical protein